MFSSTALLLGWTLAAAADHTEINPVYAALVNDGIAVTDDRRVPLPPPVMPDGLDAPAQQEAVRAASGRHGYDDVVRNSRVAPEVYEYRTIGDENGELLVYGIDVYFIVYAKLQTIADLNPEEFFDIAGNARDAKITVLNEDDLQKHGIDPADGSLIRERYEHLSYPLFDKVHLEITNQAVLTATEESIVRATRLDDRFAESKTFPNQWRPITITNTGKAEKGEPHSFRGTGMYMKITELHEPEGALFVEYHSVSVEPKAWFNGAPLIRTKLRMLLQREVRKFRHTLGEREEG